ncbi:chondroitin sulfate synthase 1 isoform X2 [Atheta coriaria]|uniref:chondroitin sulfate synthase 1 isoform X2 n=1 Tax=Dalotia coriaria TaxID=877792 RepID=UPI0031F431FD
MARKRKTLSLIVGIVLGVLLSVFLKHEGDPCGAYAPKHLVADDITSNESPSRDLLFVGVMTAARYLDTRAKAVYDTWGQHIPGKIAFFSSEQSYSTHVPLIPLIGVDDVYPPQKKSFTMLKYMHDHYLDRFEWFMRADDDVYVRMDKLEKLLRSVDSSKPWFIGQTGRGNSEEFGLLSLENDENFCMGGPGIILSRETLRKLGPHIQECLENLYTTHEDVELGRCVKKSAGISCTWSYEMQVILYHNQSSEAAFSGDLKQKEVHRAITLHPVKKPALMYRLHKYVKGLNIRARKQECIELHRDMAFSYAEMSENLRHLEEDFQYELSPHVDDRYFGEGNILGKRTSLNRFTPNSLDEVLDWEFISKSLFSYKDLNPKRRYGSSVKEGLGDVVREVMEIINQFSKQRGRVIDFKEILYGYFRLDPVHGVDVILDMLLVYKKYRGHKMTVGVRRHAYIQQTFNGMEIREINPETNLPIDTTLSDEDALHKKLIKQVISKFSENMPTLFTSASGQEQQINFVLPLSGRHDTFKRFMAHYARECLDSKENVRLIVILYNQNNQADERVLSNNRYGHYEEQTTDMERTLNLLNDYSSKYSYDNLVVKIINETFARGKALQHGVDLITNEELMFFIDVDIIFSRDFLLRLRRNVVKGKSVYFPIVFSMYNPRLIHALDLDVNLDQFEPNQDLGSWRQFGFGLCGLYKSDYILLGGFNTSISGWGFEDVNLYDKTVKSTLKIIRSVDRGLVHVWHPVVCDPNLDTLQLNMCKGTQASMLGSLRTLQTFYKTHMAVSGGHLDRKG